MAAEPFKLADVWLGEMDDYRAPPLLPRWRTVAARIGSIFRSADRGVGSGKGSLRG